jgi:hypothetical protein
MQSKQPILPKGVSNAELEFSFDLKNIFKAVEEMVCLPFSSQKFESIKSRMNTLKVEMGTNITRLNSFKKQFEYIGKRLRNLTYFTVQGTTLESNFYIKIEISLQRIIGGSHTKTHRFPILVRARRIDRAERFEYPQDPDFYEDAIQLPGANIEIRDGSGY